MKPKNKDIFPGSNARFTCNSNGVPDPELTWNFEGEAIEPSYHYQMKHTYGISTLIVREVTEDDIGDYQAIARNVAGEVASDFQLTVGGKGKPSVPKPAPKPTPKTAPKPAAKVVETEKEVVGKSAAKEKEKEVATKSP